MPIIYHVDIIVHTFFFFVYSSSNYFGVVAINIEIILITNKCNLMGKVSAKLLMN